MNIFLAHTATKLSAATGRVVVCGSHGGIYVGHLLAAAGVRAALVNDAGLGLDDAGVAGLPVLAGYGIAAAALDHRTCSIGNADSAWATGIVTTVNAPAAALGVAPGNPAREAAGRLEAATPVACISHTEGEHRRVDVVNGWRIAVVDSNALVSPGEDDGAIVITGSHGGLVGNDPESAGRVKAALFAFNDAGVGRNGAGISRLPVLGARGIAAVTVFHNSARIGDGASTLADGIVSHVNRLAHALGARAGMPLTALVDSLVEKRCRATHAA